MKKIVIICSVVVLSMVGFGAAVQNNEKLFEITKNIEIFASLFKELNTFYVDDIDPSKLMKTGIDAMVESLDPYTNYFSETQIETWRYMTEGKYEGIGANVQLVGDEITIIEPYEDCPAFEAGLRAGDVIEAIDGQPTKGRKYADLSVLLRGVPGSKLTLDIKRPGVKEVKQYTVSRGEIKMSNTPYSGLIRDHIGYVSLVTFTQDAARNVGSAIREMKKEDPDLKGVILDLRDNGGGLLVEAINLVNLFVPKGVEVVSTRSKVRDWDRSFRTTNVPLDEKIPIVVLINKKSASASEIVSGALQDLDRAVIIGQRSYGKGLVQNTKETGYNSRLKLTTSRYFIPSGRSIQSVSYKDGEPVDIPDSERHSFKTRGGRPVLDGGGVTPDITIVPDSGDAAIKSLLDNYIVFNYGTKFALNNAAISPVEEYEFTDFSDFMKYVEANNFPFETETERQLKKLESDARTDELYSVIKADVDQIRSKLKNEKRNVLINHKTQINRFITKDIVTRYYNQKGRIINSINSDPEVNEAVKVLLDGNRYDKILRIKK